MAEVKKAGLRGKLNKVVLAYSGGLDTSVIVPWLRWEFLFNFSSVFWYWNSAISSYTVCLWQVMKIGCWGANWICTNMSWLCNLCVVVGLQGKLWLWGCLLHCWRWPSMSFLHTRARCFVWHIGSEAKKHRCMQLCLKSLCLNYGFLTKNWISINHGVMFYSCGGLLW